MINSISFVMSPYRNILSRSASQLAELEKEKQRRSILPRFKQWRVSLPDRIIRWTSTTDLHFQTSSAPIRTLHWTQVATPQCLEFVVHTTVILDISVRDWRVYGVSVSFMLSPITLSTLSRRCSFLPIKMEACGAISVAVRVLCAGKSQRRL